MTALSFSRQQRATLQRGLPLQLPPNIVASPYLAQELQIGDVVTYVASTLSPVYPIPTSSGSIKKGATVVASGVSPSYTIQAADVGGVFVFAQAAANTYGTAIRNSNGTTATSRTPANQALLGGNGGGYANYSTNTYVNNAAIGGLSVVDLNANPSTGYHGGLDANGFPMSSSTWYFSAPIGLARGTDGQMAASVDGSGNPLLPGDGTSGLLDAYNVYYTSNVTNVSTDVAIKNQGTIVPGSWQSLGSNKYTFKLKVPQYSNIALNFLQPLQDLDIPRNGITPTRTTGEFYPPCLANAAQFPSHRTMDFTNTNLRTDTTWATRPIDYGPYGGTTAVSWERHARFMNAVASYPGSICRQFCINVPLKVDDNYITQMATTINSLLLPGIVLVVEYGNEIWNNVNLAPTSYCYDQAFTEIQVLQNYAGDNAFPTCIASVTASGGVATVTAGAGVIGYVAGSVLTITSYGLNAPNAVVGQTLWYAGASTGLTISSFGTGTGRAGTYNLSGSTTIGSGSNLQTMQLIGALQAFITDGASCYVNAVSSSTGSFSTVWSGSPGSAVPAPNPSPVVTITLGTPGTGQFTYPCPNTTSGTMSGMNMGIIFNTTSTLVTDGDLGLSNYWYKFQVRRAYQINALWKAVRPQDKTLLGFQEFTSANFPPGLFSYGNWLGDGTKTSNTGLKTWCDIAAIAPYIFGKSAQWGVPTIGSNVIANVPMAPYCVAGDNVTVGGVASVVVSGSGTNLTIADNATSSAVGMSYGYVPEVEGYISGTTLNITSGFLPNSLEYINKGALITSAIDSNSGVPVAIAPGTVITSAFVSAPLGIVTMSATVNNSQTVGSSGSHVRFGIGQASPAPVCLIMLQQVVEQAPIIRSFIYKCLQFGITPFAYEGGPDTSKHFMSMKELWSYGQGGVPASPVATLGTVETALLDAWFSAGGSTFHHFVIGPQAKADCANAFGSVYAINTYFGEPTPCYLALVAYLNKQIGSAGQQNATPGTLDAANATYTPTGSILTTGNGAGMWNFGGNSTARQLDWVTGIDRTGRYQMIVTGSDSIASPVSVYVDNVLIGTATMPANGSGGSTSTTPGAQTSPPLLLPSISHGGHIISCRIAAGVGSNAGIRSVAITPY